MCQCGSEIETKREDRKISLILNNCRIAEWQNLLKTPSNMLQSVAPRPVDSFTDRNPACKLPPYGKFNIFFLYFKECGTVQFIQKYMQLHSVLEDLSKQFRISESQNIFKRFTGRYCGKLKLQGAASFKQKNGHNEFSLDVRS